MDLAEAPLILMLGGLAAYVVLGGADFGAGLWYMALPGERRRPLRDHTYHAMGPVWEANHVWLIFVLVVAWTAYPLAFGSIASSLYVPLFVAALGIILRGTAYALRGSATGLSEERVLGVIFGASSVLTPFALGTAVGALASDRVPIGNAAGDAIGAWLNPTSLLLGTLSVATSAYLAAVWLTADADRGGRDDLVEDFRRLSLIAGAAAGGLALTGLVIIHEDARQLFDGLASGGGLAAVLVSVTAGVATMAFIVGRRSEAARYGSALAVTAMVAGWALAQSPEILPGLTVQEAAASDSVLVALLISLGLGAVVLVPSLGLLFTLVLQGRFDPLPDEMGSLDEAGRATAPDVTASRRPGAGPRQGLTFAAVALGLIGAVLTLLTEGGPERAASVLILLLGAAGACAALLRDMSAIGRDSP